jgi:predicted Zn-dependent peptidase
VAAALLLAWAGPLRGQRALVLPDPGSTVVSLALDLNAGGIWDPAPQAGLSRLAGEALLEALRPQLRSLGAGVRLECERFGLRLTLLAPPSTWRAATDMFLDAIFHPVVQAEALDTARARLQRSLRFQEGDPAAEIRTAAYEAFFGEGHRWARGPCGSAETLDSVTLEAAQSAVDARFEPGHASAALVGPVDRREGEAVLLRVFRESGAPTLLPLPDPAPLPGSRDIDTPTITSWIVVVFPLPRQPDDEATRLLAQHVLEGVRPGPGHPSVVDASVEVERFGGGGVLLVYVVADPASVRDWVGRVRELVDSAGATALDPGRFELLRNRYRGARLLSLAAPEARAGDAADRLLFDHIYEWPVRRIDTLTAERLRAAAAALGPPATAYLGPIPGGTASLDRRPARP